MTSYSGQLVLDIPPLYPPQEAFMRSRTRYTAYGGARGGGKSHAARIKAVLLALRYQGIQILLLRRTLQELRENHVLPLRKMLQGIAQYREQSKEFLFPGGSRIVLGYCAAESDVLQYQGQAYDVIFLEEATQFSEFQFQALTESNRVSGGCREPFSPRMYFTCNPGGVGHGWVKRLFIDRDYRKSERPEDYCFIPARVYDNRFLMERDPDYVRALENLPEDRRRAMLEGDWDSFEGQFFPEFRREAHVCKAFEIPQHWRRYISIDYGLDMFAALAVAVDETGRAWVHGEVYQPDLIVSDAAKALHDLQMPDTVFLAPPDLWNRRQETGRSVAEIFWEHGILLRKTSNRRVDGWLAVKEWLKLVPDEQGSKSPRLQIFPTCQNLIRTLPQLQHDQAHPGDCHGTPHEVTHAPDALRGFCVYHVVRSTVPQPDKPTVYSAFNIKPPRSVSVGAERGLVI